VKVLLSEEVHHLNLHIGECPNNIHGKKEGSRLRPVMRDYDAARKAKRATPEALRGYQTGPMATRSVSVSGAINCGDWFDRVGVAGGISPVRPEQKSLSAPVNQRIGMA
jgi:hypothetical protein